MDIYFLPMACSMATRIALTEANLEARFIEVDAVTKRSRHGGEPLTDVNPFGLVPALRTDDGVVITENAAVLEFVASLAPDGALAPADAGSRLRMRTWLSFVSSELHRGLFSILLSDSAPEEAKRHAIAVGEERLAALDAHLEDHRFVLGEQFTVVDAYLITILNWERATSLDLTRWPAVNRYLERGRKRESVARAMEIELPLYLEERARFREARV